jgi:hypothetical protein
MLPQSVFYVNPNDEHANKEHICCLRKLKVSHVSIVPEDYCHINAALTFDVSLSYQGMPVPQNSHAYV